MLDCIVVYMGLGNEFEIVNQNLVFRNRFQFKKIERPRGDFGYRRFPFTRLIYNFHTS